jgi:hypothetical protein
VLLKAAETTLAVGKTHFLLGASSDATRVGTFRTPDTFNATSFGHTVIGSYTPGMAIPVIKPGQDTIIQVMSIPRGQAAPPGAFNASEIEATIGPRLRRG